MPDASAAQIGLLVIFPCFFGFLALLATIFWVWMIVDCAVNEPSNRVDKIVWIIVIVFTHLLGALVYFVVRRPQRIAEIGH